MHVHPAWLTHAKHSAMVCVAISSNDIENATGSMMPSFSFCSGEMSTMCQDRKNVRDGSDDCISFALILGGIVIFSWVIFNVAE